MIDPETVEDDYREAYQCWTHLFNQGGKSIEECFKDSFLVPFKGEYDPPPMRWETVKASLLKMIEDSS